jgi:hypothetical protein
MRFEKAGIGNITVNNKDFHHQNTTKYNVLNDIINNASPVKKEKDGIKVSSLERDKHEKVSKEKETNSMGEDSKEYGIGIVGSRRKKNTLEVNSTDEKKPFYSTFYHNSSHGGSSSLTANTRDNHLNLKDYKNTNNETIEHQYGSNPGGNLL